MRSRILPATYKHKISETVMKQTVAIAHAKKEFFLQWHICFMSF